MLAFATLSETERSNKHVAASNSDRSIVPLAARACVTFKLFFSFTDYRIDSEDKDKFKGDT
jgi:hypothetical protein